MGWIRTCWRVGHLGILTISIAISKPIVLKSIISGVAPANQKKGQFVSFSQGHSGTKVQCESCSFSQGKTPEFTQKWAKFMNFPFWPFLWFGLPGRLLISVKVKRGRQKGDGKKSVRKCHDKSVPFPSNPILSEAPPPPPHPINVL